MPLGWKIKNHRKGETILETLIAMGVLVIGIMMASSIMGSSIRNINSSKNRVIAVNIAKEGLEAIRNIRDTNWLKFNSKKRECWNNDPKEEACPNAMGNFFPIAPGNYIVYKQPINESDLSLGWKWRLENIGGRSESVNPPPDLGPGDKDTYHNTTDGKTYTWNGTKWVDLTQLYIVDMDVEMDTDGDHNYFNDPDTYNHALVEEDNALGKNLAVRTNFRRQIAISYLDDGGNVVNNPGANRMVIRAKVTWQEGKNEFSTDLVTHLSDYMGRESLSN
jgi:hypothetical protein